MSSETCEWGQTDDVDLEISRWWTTCDETFTFIEGGPRWNGCKFCCYCGKPLVEVPLPEEDDD
jgi:hypothetical protein